MERNPLVQGCPVQTFKNEIAPFTFVRGGIFLNDPLLGPIIGYEWKLIKI